MTTTTGSNGALTLSMAASTKLLFFIFIFFSRSNSNDPEHSYPQTHLSSSLTLAITCTLVNAPSPFCLTPLTISACCPQPCMSSQHTSSTHRQADSPSTSSSRMYCTAPDGTHPPQQTRLLGPYLPNLSSGSALPSHVVHTNFCFDDEWSRQEAFYRIFMSGWRYHPR